MTEIIIGVDIGTGSTKAIAFDIKSTTILDSVHQCYPTDYHGNQHEQDPLSVYHAFKKACRTLTTRLPPHKLAAIVFSSALHSLLAVDKMGNPLTPCIIWSDSRSNKQAGIIRANQKADEIYRQTGTPIHPMSPLCKIAHIRQTLPEIFRKTHKFISIKAYILHKLGHEFLVDHSLASATGLFDIEKLQWHDYALETAGTSPEHLSHPVPTTHLLKVKTNEETRSLGISEGTPIIIGGGDGPMANLGSLTLEKNQGCLTLGTSGAVRVTSEKILKDPSKRIFNYIIDHQLYAAGGAVNNGGIVLNWLQTLFMNQSKDGKDYHKLLAEAAAVSPGSEGLIFLPWILGERAPVWDTEVKGIYYGISLHHQPQHFMRSGLEGIGFNLLNIAKIIQQLSGKIEKINFNGGLARSEFFCQMLADIFGVEINVIPQVDLSAYGAIVLALKALGYINNFDQAPELNKQLLVFYPNPEHAEIYQKNFEGFMELLAFNSAGSGT
ncbi:MAG: gluconokinase [Cytophagales bacterium]|nr:gluconokinase [Cytophagales bacterium]